MKECKVIKDVSIIVKWELAIRRGIRKGKFTERQYLFFLLALGTGLQFEELINIKYEDLKLVSRLTNGTGRPKELMYIELPSKFKRRKIREIIFPDNCKKKIEELQKKYSDDVYLFQNKSSNMIGKPPAAWTVTFIRNFLVESAEMGGVPAESFGASMLRKSFGYFQLKHGDWSLRDLQRYFEMRSVSLLKKYLDVTDEESD